MHSALPLDCAGRRRSPATLSGFHQGRPPRNKGLRYPPGPPTVEEIIAVMRAAGDRPGGAETARRDRRAVACRVENQRGARLGGERSRPNPRRRAGAPRQGRQASRGWNGPLGLGAARSVAQDARGAARRRALLCAPRTHPRPPLLPRRDPHADAKRRPRGRRQATVRAAPLSRPARYANPNEKPQQNPMNRRLHIGINEDRRPAAQPTAREIERRPTPMRCA